MNQYQMMRKIQKKKMGQTKQGKKESGWDERFYLAKIPDYKAKNEQVPYIKQIKSQLNSTSKKFLINSAQIPICEEQDAFSDIDPEIIDLWNILFVTADYRKKFQQKLSYFKEGIHWQLYETEKNTLKKVYEYMINIQCELSSRDKNIETILKLYDKFKREDQFPNDNSLLINTYNCLKHIRENNRIIVSSTNNLRNCTLYDIKNGKYNLPKLNNNEIFEPSFLSNLNNDLHFIFSNVPFRSFLQFKGNYDPMLLEMLTKEEFVNDDAKSLLNDNCYTMLNDMIYSNYIYIKGKDKGSTLFANHSRTQKSQSKQHINLENHNRDNRANLTKKKNILNACANQSHSKGEELTKMNADSNSCGDKHHRNEEKYAKIIGKEVIDCDQSKHEKKQSSMYGTSFLYQDNNDNNGLIESDRMMPLHAINEDHISNYSEKKKKHKENQNKLVSNQKKIDETLTFEFHTGTLASIEKEYNRYYSLIPDSQKITFNLSNDINSFTEGIHPMLIVSYKSKSLNSLCLLVISHEDPSIIVIQQISTLEDNISEVFLKIIMFIQDNILYKELDINLHFENKNNKSVLDQDLLGLITGLNFKWSKLENLDSGRRIQTMKYKNVNTNLKGNTINDVCVFKTGMVAWESEENLIGESNADHNFQRINLINKQLIEFLIQRSEKATEIMESFSNFKVYEGLKEETFNFLKECDCNDKDLLSRLTLIERQELYSCCYKLIPMIKTLSTRAIDQFIYNRIEIRDDILFEKDTNQTFYMLEEDDYIVLLGEISPDFKNYIDNSNNIYESFNSLYSKFEVVRRDIKHIWVPTFSYSESSKYSFGDKQNIELRSFTNSSLFTSKFQGKTISQEPKSSEAVISGSFFLAVISVNLSNILDNSAIFCAVIDNSNWQTV